MGGGTQLMRYLSVCSGIEAATEAWKPLGWECAGLSEIEPFPRAVLEQRHGAVPVDFDHRHAPQSNVLPLFGDFTKIEAHHVGPIDLLVGGTPCQSFSIAGKRLGLDDPRGNLTLEFLALARRLRARWILWENVPGVLSHDEGRTLGTFLRFVGECGYRFAYRVLDAQYVRVDGFGCAVPQRRRRVFLVGYSGDGPGPEAVLFDRESLRGNPAPRREAGQGVAPTLAARTRGGGGLGTDFDGGLITSHDPACTLTAREYKGALPEADLSTVVAHTLKGEGFDASEGGAGRGTPIIAEVAGAVCRDSFTGGMGGRPEGAAAGHFVAEPLAFSAKDHGADAIEGVSPTLRAGGHSASHANAGVMPAIAIQERATSENPDAGPDGAGVRDDGAAYTLEARQVPQAVAFAENQRGEVRTNDTANLTVGGGKPGQGYPAVVFKIGQGAKARSIGYEEGVSPTLTSRDSGTQRSPGLIAPSEPWAVRRLTPRECERLQGFPDDHTKIEWRGKPADQCPDGPRYKAVGNSMAVNVMRWLGERIDVVERARREAA